MGNFLPLLFLLQFLVCLIPPSQSYSTDSTLISQSYGYDVVYAANTKIRQTKIFADDNRFLLRMAYVETKYGVDSQTFLSPKTLGGIWQVSPETLKSTQGDQGSLKQIREKILNHFDINWSQVVMTDLQKPLHSALAVKIFLTTISASIPDTISRQAEFWKKHFNPKSSTATFISDVKEVEKESPCSGRMKLVLVMDGSGSVGSGNFVTAKKFIADLASTFDPLTVPMGFLVYSSGVKEVFSLSANYDMESRRKAILHAIYPGGGTETHLAIQFGMNMLIKGEDENNNSPRILVIFTDGQSNNVTLTNLAAESATAHGVTTFACGIGGYVNVTELLIIAQHKPSQVLTSSSFEALTEFPYRVNEETCSIPQTPPTNGSVSDKLNKDETRYFSYEMTQAGITLTINTTSGQTTGFYSYSFPTPSSAINDGNINGTIHIPYQKPNNNIKDNIDLNLQPSEKNMNISVTMNVTQIFVSVRGLEDTNEFCIESVEGDDSSSFIFKSQNVLILFALLIVAFTAV